jgi:hypothetical protein
LVLQGWLERREMHGDCLAAVDDMAGQDAADVSDLPRVETISYSHAGWLSIAVSSVLFGLAHYGHGVSPAPLILLGVVLGYLYRQTHRTLPCIVCHMLFNGFTFVLLALQFAMAG